MQGKRILIPYGMGTQALDVPKARLAAVLEPKYAGEVQIPQDQIVRHTLENPIASPLLRELAKGKQKIVLITSDHTRPVPSHITLPILLAEIRAGEPEADITILVATGMHRATTTAEMRTKFGDAIVDNETIVVHDALADADMAYFGVLPSGGALWLNKLVQQADLLIAEGFVEPHFFAGFSGGRKSILPGVAAKQTVLYNHNAMFIQHSAARQGSIKGNPIHKDMLFAAQAAKLRFILNVLIDEQKQIVAAVAGDCEQAHAVGCKLCNQLARVQSVVSDIAITSNGGYPLDQNIYQAVKGMTAAEACVKQNGVIIICAALGDGHGGEAFYEWFAKRGSAAEVAQAIAAIPAELTHMDQWEAQILARVMLKATCIFVTGEENRQLVESMHMQWAPDVNAALQMATDLLGSDSRVTVIPNGVGVIVG